MKQSLYIYIYISRFSLPRGKQRILETLKKFIAYVLVHYDSGYDLACGVLERAI